MRLKFPPQRQVKPVKAEVIFGEQECAGAPRIGYFFSGFARLRCKIQRL